MTTLERQLRDGRALERAIGSSQLVHLYYESWRTEYEARQNIPPRARFIVEVTTLGGRQISKQAWDEFEKAETEFNTFERRYAVEAAKKALGLNPGD